MNKGELIVQQPSVARTATQASDSRLLLAAMIASTLSAAIYSSHSNAAGKLQIEEASIASIQSAIKSGDTTCKQVVQAYLDRAKAYNGVCTALITPEGKSVAAVKGYKRAGRPLSFPTKTVKASSVFPDLDQYKGLPLDYGRMEKTVSDPSVYAQMGMRVGMPDAGQLNALETLNIRGERSVTCKGKFDAHPTTGPLPAGAPAACEEFRKQPDALERAAELDAKYGSNPDLEALPMYCVVSVFKDPYDTKDMRTTSNNDVNFAMDVPPFDSTLVAQLRAKGAIIYAKSIAHEFNGGPGNPGGDSKEKTNWVDGGQTLGAWGGQEGSRYARLLGADGPLRHLDPSMSPWKLRPTLAEILQASDFPAAVRRARRHGYRMADIAAHMGTSESTVSRQAKE